MELGMIMALLPVAVWCGVLSACDWKERRLPNWLTVGGSVAVLTWRYGYGGAQLFMDGFAAAAGAGAFLLLPFLARGAGGGDVKMLFAGGAIVGWAKLLSLLVITSFAGLALGIAMLAFGRLDGSRLRHYLRCAVDWGYDRKAGAAGLAPRESSSARVPFSLAIAAGIIGAMLE